MNDRSGRRSVAAGAAVLLLGIGLSLGWGQPADTQKPLPPGVTPPSRSTALVELTVPAGIKVALDGTKLTHNEAKHEVVTEGEATLRLSNHILLRAHGARVTVSTPSHHGSSRIVIEPTPATVAAR
jgi:hypothetical protein